MYANLLFIIDPLETLHLETDTTFAIMAEAHKRGHHVWTATSDELYMDDPTSRRGSNGLASPRLGLISAQVPCGHVTQIFIKNRSWKNGNQKDAPLESFPVIMMRKDPPFSGDYILATSLLSLVDPQKTFIINNPAALRNFNEKLGIFQFPQFIPETIVSKKNADFNRFLKKHKKIVLKPLEGFAGHEIIILSANDKNKNSLFEMLTKHEKRYLMAQKYLPAVEKGDKRILILDGEILGQQNRIAAKDDHRSNISAGGSSHRTQLSAHEREVAQTVGQALKDQGIYFAGLDLIGGCIKEINVTSPTGLVKINEHEGAHLEKKVVDFLEKYL